MKASVSLEEYLDRMDEVEGWFDRMDALTIAECLMVQQQEGISGALAEIGVHHGKSLLAMALTEGHNDLIYAIDVFERQELNIDGSGCGNRQAFLANCDKFAPTAKVTILAMSSLEIRGREREIMEPLRFLSIDGGHTRDITLNDLEIADSILVDAGMCCVDDVLHPEWTGVITGIFAFLDRNPNLVPFALTPKKLYWCRPSYYHRRREHFRTKFAANMRRADREIGNYLVDYYCL